MQVTVDFNSLNLRLDSFCFETFFEEYLNLFGLELTRTKIQNFIKTGEITVNNLIKKPSYKLRENDVVNFICTKKEEAVPSKKNIPLDILYEDDYLIVLNKQKNLICHPTAHNIDDTLVSALLYHTDKLSDIQGSKRRGIVHRLDKNTSGLMLAAKTNEAHLKLQKDIQTKKTIRKYLALVCGVVKEDSGTINKPLVHYMNKTVKMKTSETGLSAITDFKVIERFSDATFLEIQLQTGRTHQIRCHLASVGHPVFGDELYGAKGFRQGILKNLKTTGQILMSYYLCFTHPVSFEIMEFEIPPENYHPDLKKALDLLRSKK